MSQDKGIKVKKFAAHTHKCIHITLRRKSLGNYSLHICKWSHDCS